MSVRDYWRRLDLALNPIFSVNRWAQVNTFVSLFNNCHKTIDISLMIRNLGIPIMLRETNFEEDTPDKETLLTRGNPTDKSGGFKQGRISFLSTDKSGGLLDQVLRSGEWCKRASPILPVWASSWSLRVRYILLP